MELCITKIILTGVVFTISCILILTLAFTIVPEQYNEMIRKNFGLIDNNFQYQLFMEPFTQEYRIYLFHVVNKDEIMNNKKPILMEIGPYIYRETRTKTAINSNDDTITYKEDQQFQFDSVASYPLTEQDKITVLNIPLMFAYQIAQIDGDERFFKNNYQNDLFIEIQVEELLFSGLKFCEEAQTIQFCSTLKNNRYIKRLDDNSIEFSFTKYRTSVNNTLTVNRGIRDNFKLGQINMWNDRPYSIFWDNRTTCGQIAGTDSTLFPPDIDIDTDLRIFSTDVGRTYNVTYFGDIIYKGIKGEVFQTDPLNLWFHSDNPESDCFCTKLTLDPDDKKQCYLDGILDFQPVTGAPVLLSMPHFLWADTKYTLAIDGLHPQENRHRTYFIIEPNTGITLEGVYRSQLNTILRPIDVANFTNIPRVVLPLLWIEEAWSLTDTVIDDLNQYYFDPAYQRVALQWGLVAICIFVAILFIFILKNKIVA